MPRLRLRFALWRAGDGWRWRLRAANGEKIAAATEAYTTRHHAWENARMVVGHRVPDVSAMQDVGGGRFFALIADDRDDEA